MKAEKWCYSCKKVKLITEFHKNKRSSDGFNSMCKECTSEYKKSYYLKNRDEIRESHNKYAREHSAEAVSRVRRWVSNNPDKANRLIKKYQANNPEKRKAHIIAIQSGKLQKRSCEICGNSKAQAHHDDYSKPLDVRWLCHKHHVEFHNK
jgi:ribosomal protein S27AE